MLYYLNGEYWDAMLESCYNNIGVDMMYQLEFNDYMLMYCGA
jgi:hypothetical protein